MSMADPGPASESEALALVSDVGAADTTEETDVSTGPADSSALGMLDVVGAAVAGVVVVGSAVVGATVVGAAVVGATVVEAAIPAVRSAVTSAAMLAIR